MRTNIFKAGLLMIAMAALVLGTSSCSKEEDSVSDTSLTDLTVTKDQVEVEYLLDDVMRQSEEAVDLATDSLGGPGGPGGPKPPLWGPCATVTIVPFDTITWPKTITVDFGPVNCLCNDGKYRRGQIISVVTAPPQDSLSTRTVTTQNYFVNDHKIEGVKTFINMGHVNGMQTFSMSISNGKVTRPNGTFSTLNAQRTRVFAQGESTPWPAIYDDVWMVSGTESGTAFNGASFSVNITTPLEIPRACSWIVSGVKEVQRGTHPLRVVDYGTGNCDNIITVTVNGNSHTVYLP